MWYLTQSTFNSLLVIIINSNNSYHLYSTYYVLSTLLTPITHLINNIYRKNLSWYKINILGCRILTHVYLIGDVLYIILCIFLYFKFCIYMLQHFMLLRKQKSELFLKQKICCINNNKYITIYLYSTNYILHRTCIYLLICNLYKYKPTYINRLQIYYFYWLNILNIGN